MKEFIGWVFAGALVVVVALGLSWAVMGNNFFLYSYFAPKMENVRRNTFEQSKAFNQGMIQELQNMQFQYEQADASHKQALASLILHRAADYDQDRLPPDLYSFIEHLKRERAK